MNNVLLIFLGVFVAFGTSWCAIVGQTWRQLAAQQEVRIVGSDQRYPAPRGGLAERGAQVYRQEGCYYCHSQQVRPSGYAFNLHLEKLPDPAVPGPEAEKFTNEVIKAVLTVNPKKPMTEIRRDLRRGASTLLARHADEADVAKAQKAFAAAGAEKALSVELVATGPEIMRTLNTGWGPRETVPLDYLHDDLVMPGSVRYGPDLANVGERKRLDLWHLSHLYDPQTLEGTTYRMPPYPHLFKLQPKGSRPRPGALRLPPSAIPEDYELVPTEDARALAAYLVSLRADANLFEARSPKLGIPDVPGQ
jgi:cbb3-type cytochrome oxidase cytochrome c subunit